MSDILATLREAVQNPEKAKEAIAGLQAKLPSMTEEQKRQAAHLLSDLKDRAEALPDEVRGRLGTLPEETRTQLNAFVARFKK